MKSLVKLTLFFGLLVNLLPLSARSHPTKQSCADLWPTASGTENQYALGLLIKIKSENRMVLGIGPYLATYHADILKAAQYEWGTEDVEPLWGGELQMETTNWAGPNLQARGIFQVNETWGMIRLHKDLRPIPLTRVHRWMSTVEGLLANKVELIPWDESKPYLLDTLNIISTRLKKQVTNVRHEMANMLQKLQILGFGAVPLIPRFKGTSHEVYTAHGTDPDFWLHVLVYAKLMSDFRVVELNTAKLNELFTEIQGSTEIKAATAKGLAELMGTFTRQWEALRVRNEILNKVVFIDIPSKTDDI